MEDLNGFFIRRIILESDIDILDVINGEYKVYYKSKNMNIFLDSDKLYLIEHDKIYEATVYADLKDDKVVFVI